MLQEKTALILGYSSRNVAIALLSTAETLAGT